jgi:hypothetical protein
MQYFTTTQKALILLIFNQEEAGLDSSEAWDELLKTGIDYDNVIIDNDDGVHYPGYEIQELI